MDCAKRILYAILTNNVRLHHGGCPTYKKLQFKDNIIIFFRETVVRGPDVTGLAQRGKIDMLNASQNIKFLAQWLRSWMIDLLLHLWLTILHLIFTARCT